VRYKIFHQVIYAYDHPVALDPHWIQLRPRCDVTQTLHRFLLEIDPTSQQVTENIDLDGNAVIQVRFPATETTRLVIRASSEVETYRINPFDYLLEPWAVTLPIDYPAALWQRLQPYLGGQFAGGLSPALDPTAAQLAEEIWLETDGNVVSFLTRLNQRIQQTCSYGLRETGSPFPPGITWNRQSGSCRDYAVLFMEVCRAAGLASRFVSGYQEGDPDQDDRHLHAWAEVYLPGAGWRGYDPTNGIAVANRHIALVATPTARNSTPVIGTRKSSGVRSEMQYGLKIELL
jgi:transglutaminase-like putative cysteine protease